MIEAFRQSLINDYLTCPRKFYFLHELGLQPEQTSFAAVIGTAGHRAIQRIHQKGIENVDPSSVRKGFEPILYETIAEEEEKGLEVVIPNEKRREEIITEAVEAIQGYMDHPRNQGFDLILNEATFELELGHRKKYRFTGTIDQVRRYPGGEVHVVDLKFGEAPSGILMDLNFQLSIYALSVREGKFGGAYLGMDLPDKVVMVRMKDFIPYKRSGKKRVRGEMIHYKKGDLRGPGFYESTRAEKEIKSHVVDLSRICGSIRRRSFYRRPVIDGPCHRCEFKRMCLEDLNLQGERRK